MAILEGHIQMLEGLNQRLTNLNNDIWYNNQKLSILNIKLRLTTNITATSLIIEEIKKTKGMGEQDILRYIRLSNYSLDELQILADSKTGSLFDVEAIAMDFERTMKAAAKKIEDYTLLASERPQKFPLSAELKEIISSYNETILRGYQLYKELKQASKEPRFWLPKDGQTIIENYLLIQPKDDSTLQSIFSYAVEEILASRLKYMSRKRDELKDIHLRVDSIYKVHLFNKLMKSPRSLNKEKLSILSEVSINNLWEQQAFEIVLTDIKDELVNDDLIGLADSVHSEKSLLAFIDVAKMFL